MSIGVLIGLIVYGIILSSTNNPYIALLGFAIVLAFWIGTLKVVLKSEY